MPILWIILPITLLIIWAIYQSGIGNRYLYLSPQATAVHEPHFLNCLPNPPEIYGRPPAPHLYIPFTLEMDPLDRYLICNFSGDDIYWSLELQVCEDRELGRGARVFLCRRDGGAEMYATAGMQKRCTMTRLAPPIEFHPTMIKYQLDINEQGVTALVKMKDKAGRPILFAIHERQKRLKTSDFLTPAGFDVTAAPFLPIYFARQMAYARLRHTEIGITIDDQPCTPDYLPIPYNGRFVYTTRYTPAPVIGALNEARQEPLHPVPLTNATELIHDDTRCQLHLNNGHPEIVALTCTRAPKHTMTLHFSPAFPDIAALKPGVTVNGRFTISIDNIGGVIGGSYTTTAFPHHTAVTLNPTEAWQPIPGPPWVRQYQWQAILQPGPDNTLLLHSAWEKPAALQ